MFKIIKKNNQGFSLIEMIVVIAIFSVTILSAADIFKWVVEGQRNALAAQNVQENMRYAFEAMSKEIRNAQRSDGSCKNLLSPVPTPAYKVYNTALSDSTMYFKNKNTVCVAYYLDNNAITVNRDGTIYAITPNEIKISNLIFSVADDLISALHTVQPRVTMAMDVEAVGKILHQQKMRLQFTISSRFYE